MARFVPRERKHKRLAKARPRSQAQPIPDELIPESKSEREARRAKLAQDLRDQQPQSKISGKKRKRLDKYVDTKLRKEENLELLKKLAAHKVDTSLLQSSKKLGRVGETKRERFSRILQERQAGLNGNGAYDAILFERRQDVEPASDEDEDDEDDQETASLNDEIAQVILDQLPATDAALGGFGSGLKRPLETDEAGQPMIKKRKRQKRGRAQIPALAEVIEDDERPSEEDEAALSSNRNVHDDAAEEEEEEEQEEEWKGFGSGVDIDEQADESLSESSNESESDVEASNDTTDELFDGADFEQDTAGSDSESAPSTGSGKKERVSAFKQWADQLRNTALDFTPSTLPTDNAAVKANFKPRQTSPEPSLPVAQPGGERTSRPEAAITIPRSEEIQAARLELPVVQEEQKIMEAVHSNPIVIVCGATGSGKTTQVPQMMLESGYGSHIGDRGNASTAAGPQSKGVIGVTQPRRVAATSVAERVSTELGPAYRTRVAHQVRYDTNVSRDTAIKFMTDGILLREISQDFILSKYSAIVIDEAHERSVNTDILIGMLSRIVSLRAELAKEEPDQHYPLKLVIMSATLRVSDFAENRRLFKDSTPPTVEAEGRQYPVTVHFSRRTQRDYVDETVEKVAKGHRKLPPGGMLVFLTSQNDIQTVAKRLRDKLGSNTAGYSLFGKEKDADRTDDFEDLDNNKRSNDYLEGEEDADGSDSETEITGLDSDAEDEDFTVQDQELPQFGARHRGVLKPHILPLYAALPSAQQLRVFQPPPEGSRLIVLATNVAETSLTIPGIRYVFDCGRAKEKRYDMSTGVQTFEVDWISKASASQRTGRAGRTGPGHCYRLYSSAVYERYFAEHTIPEILRTPLESTVLQLKAMDIENVVNFPLPTSPDAVQLAQAERLLRNLGAISEKHGTITETGKQIMAFPVSPRFGKMLLLAQRNGVLAHTIAIVAGLAVGDLYVPEAQVGITEAEDRADTDSDESGDDRRGRRQADAVAKGASQQRHQAYTRSQATLSRWDDQSDVIKLLTAVAAHADSAAPNKPLAAASKFCEDFFLREKGMSEVQQLRHQLHNIVSARHPTLNGTFKDALPLPSEKKRKMLNQVVAAGFIEQVAIRSDLLSDGTPGFGRKPRRSTEVPYTTLVPSSEVDKTLPLQEQAMQKSVFVHPSSVLAHLSVKEMPQYIVYSHLSRAAPATIDAGGAPRTRMHPLTVVGAKQLAALAEGTPLLELGKSIGKIEELSRSVDGMMRRQCWISLSLRAPDGSSSWPLSAWKVIQRRGKKGDWEIEKVVSR